MVGERSLLQGNGLVVVVQSDVSPSMFLLRAYSLELPYSPKALKTNSHKPVQKSVSETPGTYWLWVCVAEPVGEEVGFWFR